MVLELQRADRMRDALDRVGLAVRIVVARIDRPFVAGARMVRMQDPVQHGIAQIDVAGGHVDFRAQDTRAVWKLTGLHAAEQVEILLHRTIAERRLPAGLGQRAAREANLLLRLVVDISEPIPDQSLRPFIETVEIIRGIERLAGPFVAEPAHIGLDGIDVFLLFLGRIGVVEAQIAAASKLLRDAEIERDRLGVADMQIAVRLRREPGHDLPVLARGEIGLDDVADEVAPCLCRRRFCCRHSHVLTGKSAALLPNSQPRAKPALPRPEALVMHRSCYTPPPLSPVCPTQ